MPTPRLPPQLLCPLNPLPSHAPDPPPQLLLDKLNNPPPPVLKPLFTTPTPTPNLPPNNTSVPRARDPQNLLLSLEPDRFRQSAHVSAQSAVSRGHLLVHERAFERARFGRLREPESTLR